MNDLGARATAWADRWWDESAGLLQYPSTAGSPTNPYEQPGVHRVRESATYAVALLERGQPGDVQRAERALTSVLAFQIDDPASVTHGTWRRSPIEPVPGDAPREWIDYDPNWREFIGTAFAMALANDHLLSPRCVADMEAALRLACEGTIARELDASYTNIALMSAFLLDWAGERLGESSWRRRGEALGAGVVEGYEEQGAFPEHNSPTYYGIDLYGLALWRARAPSEVLRRRGAALEAGLWNDLARFYHAGLGNLCGPYSRAYGMDMGRYVAALGGWIAPWAAPDAQPLPPFGEATPHAHDFLELPIVDVLGSVVPDGARAHLEAFSGPRAVEQQITSSPERCATARLHPEIMWGGERTSGNVIHWQHHPATVHWRTPSGRIAWIRLVTNVPVDAVATPSGLEIGLYTRLDWLRGAPINWALEIGLDDPVSWDGEWLGLPALGVRLGGDTSRVSLEPADEAGIARLRCRYEAGEAPADLSIQLDLDPASSR